MPKVGIYVDYKHNETTLTAVMLANWMLRLGNSVRIVSNGPVAKNVDSYWDDRVLRDNFRNRNCYTDLTHAFWFYPDRLSFFTAKFIGEHNPRANTLSQHTENDNKTETIKHLYFPGWCDRSALNNELLLNSKVICLNRDCAAWLSGNCREFDIDQRWSNLCSSDKLLVPKLGRFEKKKTKLLVLLGSDFVQDIGTELFETMEKLLVAQSTLRVTFMLEKSLPKLHRNHLKRLKKRFDSRVVLAGIMPYSQYHAMTYIHDWVYIACASFRHGSLIPHLAVSGTPLICHDIPPARTYMSNTLSGLLVPTPAADTFRPRGLVCFDAVMSTIIKAVETNEIGLKGLQQNNYNQKKRQSDEFTRFLTQEIN